MHLPCLSHLTALCFPHLNGKAGLALLQLSLKVTGSDHRSSGSKERNGGGWAECCSVPRAIEQRDTHSHAIWPSPAHTLSASIPHASSGYPVLTSRGGATGEKRARDTDGMVPILSILSVSFSWPPMWPVQKMGVSQGLGVEVLAALTLGIPGRVSPLLPLTASPCALVFPCVKWS